MDDKNESDAECTASIAAGPIGSAAAIRCAAPLGHDGMHYAFGSPCVWWPKGDATGLATRADLVQEMQTLVLALDAELSWARVSDSACPPTPEAQHRYRFASPAAELRVEQMRRRRALIEHALWGVSVDVEPLPRADDTTRPAPAPFVTVGAFPGEGRTPPGRS